MITTYRGKQAFAMPTRSFRFLVTAVCSSKPLSEMCSQNRS